MAGIVWTEKNKCKQCYTCVRQCEVKAVRVKNGQAEVLSERCIACGNCVKVCSQNAKTVRSGIKETLDILSEKQFKVAALAPSFPAAFKAWDYKKMIVALKTLGFDEVWEVAVGAQLIAMEYEKLLKNATPPIIGSTCPAVVNFIEKHHPNLISYLAPVVSPMIATGRLIKTVYPGVQVVFIGPCIAKKDEAEKIQGVDVVLTFQELEDILISRKIDVEFLTTDHCYYDTCFDSPVAEKAFRGFPVSGGLYLSLKDNFDFSRNIIVVGGKDGAVSCIENIEKSDFKPFFVDILMCNGCIDGPFFKNVNYFTNWEKVEAFVQENQGYNKSQESLGDFIRDFKNYSKVNLYRTFTNMQVSLKYPSEKEIQKILSYTNKFTKEDELNCGACGYSSCREKALAVYNDIAEKDMCLPFLLTKEMDEKATTMEYNREMNAIIESSYDGIFVSDSEGRTLRLNRAFARFLDKPLESLIGVKAEKLEEERIIYPSLTHLVLKEKRRLTLIQETSSGKKILSTGNPIYDDKGRVSRVVINSRDMEELNRLGRDSQEALKMRRYMEQSLKKEDAGPLPKIVSISLSMEKIIKLSLRVASVNTTVLILGESGVGKGLIARFIHENSPRHKGPYIKINCGSIPESLLESELFGYETGAFTGAKREGKPGLIEMADKGTLLLDEIGDLPLNLQVKLLQVLQEHELTRIGGTKPVKVDIRTIAATNKDLKKMVDEGQFREDLYYRLNVVPLIIPSLRERIEDIELLIDYFLSHYNQKHNKNISFDEGTRNILKKYSWPGNVRELENLVERLTVISEKDCITMKDLPQNIIGKKTDQKITVEGIMPLKEAIELVESQLLQMAQNRCKTTYEMAELLDVNQSTIVRKLQKLGINE
ncbi:MAG: sigma 54-interacting transcriptional regulator [Tepidanaerobacteraceae bacterium]|jgi:transcriptional regulator with PAS, ATPase and Fis domain/NAD-dependent dihydropyrimidine dehydrogenase PreA subunit